VATGVGDAATSVAPVVLPDATAGLWMIWPVLVRVVTTGWPGLDATVSVGAGGGEEPR
jgi:hypothetical protein